MGVYTGSRTAAVLPYVIPLNPFDRGVMTPVSLTTNHFKNTSVALWSAPGFRSLQRTWFFRMGGGVSWTIGLPLQPLVTEKNKLYLLSSVEAKARSSSSSCHFAMRMLKALCGGRTCSHTEVLKFIRRSRIFHRWIRLSQSEAAVFEMTCDSKARLQTLRGPLSDHLICNMLKAQSGQRSVAYPSFNCPPACHVVNAQRWLWYQFITVRTKQLSASPKTVELFCPSSNLLFSRLWEHFMATEDLF